MKLSFIQVLHKSKAKHKKVASSNATILAGMGIEYLIYDVSGDDELLKVAKELQNINKDLIYIKKKFVSNKKSFVDAVILSNCDHFLFLEEDDMVDVKFLETVNHNMKNAPQRILLDKKTAKHFAENFPYGNFKNEKLLLWLKPKKTFLEKVRLRYFW